MSLPLYFWTSAFAFIGTFVYTECAHLKFYHGSLDNYTVTPLEEPLPLLPFFNKNLVSMFYIFGYTETAESEGTQAILSAYLQTSNTNVLLVDWSEEARVGYGGVFFTYLTTAVPNTNLVGEKLGQTLITLIQNGISENKIHLVGHSLGAHVAGFAGAYVTNYGLQLERITGLDPAGPVFDILNNGLNSFNARFVDVIHTNPGQYGRAKSIGTVDFWPNCGDPVQPGCPKDEQWFISPEGFCSHKRSYLYFSEAILSPTSYPAIKADSCQGWKNRGYSSQVIYLGDYIDPSARGNYYLSTRSDQPFSRGRQGLVPDN